MMKKSGNVILQKIKNIIQKEEFIMRNKRTQKDFTRDRKMTFSNLIYFMISTIKHSLQKELTGFMDKIRKKETITKSAFCQQRMKLKPEAFVELNDELVKEFYTDNEIKTLSDFRLISIDGSSIELPFSREIIDEYGVNNEHNMIPVAKIATVYDLLNNIILGGQIAPSGASEYNLAINLIKYLKENDLVLLDRGYVAYWLFYLLTTKKIDFLIRIPKEFSDDVCSFWNSEDESEIFYVNELPKRSSLRIKEFGMQFRPFSFRLVKFKLKNGETEVIATSLIDEKKYSVQFFKETYFLRWGIEENYKHLKNHHEIGNFTGYSSIVIKQDFYANLFIANLQAIILRDAQFELEKETQHRKHEYKINKNLSLGFMKDKIVDILMNKNDSYEELKKLFLIEPVPIRNGRSFERKHQRHKRKYYLNQKRGT